MIRWLSLILAFSIAFPQNSFAFGICYRALNGAEDSSFQSFADDGPEETITTANNGVDRDQLSARMTEYLGAEGFDELVAFKNQIRDNSYELTHSLCYGFREHAAKYAPDWWETGGPYNPLYYDKVIEGIFQTAMDPQLRTSIFNWSKFLGEGLKTFWQENIPFARGHLRELFIKATDSAWYKNLAGSLFTRYLTSSAGFKRASAECFNRPDPTWTPREVKKFNKHTPEYWRKAFTQTIWAADAGTTGVVTIASFFVGGFLLKAAAKFSKPVTAAVKVGVQAVRSAKYFRASALFVLAIGYLIADGFIYSIGEDQKKIENVKRLEDHVNASLQFRNSQSIEDQTLSSAEILVLTQVRLRKLQIEMDRYAKDDDTGNIEYADARDDVILQFRKAFAMFTSAHDKFNPDYAGALFIRVSRECGRPQARGQYLTDAEMTPSALATVGAACANDETAYRYSTLATALYLDQKIRAKAAQLQADADERRDQDMRDFNAMTGR